MVARDITRKDLSMPSNTPATTMRIEPEARRDATVILDELWLSISTAVITFLNALIQKGVMPFKTKVTPKKGEE